jgi:hypothetical protein
MDNKNKDANLKSDDLKNLNVLRTYTSDMADMVRTNEASVIKIALAEKSKREQEQLIEKVEGTTSKKFFWFLMGFIILAIAIFGIYYSLEKRKERNTPIPITSVIKSPISYESFSSVNITGYYDPQEIINLIKAEANKFGDWGKIKLISVVKNTNDIESPLLANEFLSLVRSSSPATFTRSLANDFIVGSYYSKQALDQISSEQKSFNMFIVFEINDYNQAYASILNWEKTLLGDLYNFFSVNINDDNKNILDKKWQDLIVNNRDVRTLNNYDGQGLLYYGFVDKNYLIITDSKEALNEITFRLIYKETK